MDENVSKAEQLLYALCRWIAGTILRTEDEKKTLALFQFAKFAIVGVSNTAVSYVINIAVLFLLAPLQLPWDYVAANLAAFVLSVLWSFYWNYRFVFRTRAQSKKELLLTLLRCYVAYSFTGIFLTNALSWLWITKLGISKFIAPLLNLILSVPINFIINKVWTFKA